LKQAIVFFFFCIAPILGCQTVNPAIGKGPVTLSHNVVTAFEQYKTNSRPTYFAISGDGRIAHSSRCPMHAMAGCVDDGGDRLLSACNHRARMRGLKPCFLFASEKDIVWQGPIAVQQFEADFFVALTKGGTVTQTYSGKGEFSKNKQELSIIVGTCTGSANLAEKKWVITKCKNGSSASGTLVSGSGPEAYYGIGRDSKGESFEIKFFDAQKVVASIERTVPAVASMISKDEQKTLSEVKATTKINSNSSDVIVRPIAIEWEGVSELLAGEIQFVEGAGGGKFSIRMPNRLGERCSGTYRFKSKTEGIWSIACNDSRAASGEFQTHGKDAGSSGSGLDTNGNKVKLTVGAKQK
jgi:hypothetical protein